MANSSSFILSKAIHSNSNVIQLACPLLDSQNSFFSMHLAYAVAHMLSMVSLEESYTHAITASLVLSAACLLAQSGTKAEVFSNLEVTLSLAHVYSFFRICYYTLSDIVF